MRNVPCFEGSDDNEQRIRLYSGVFMRLKDIILVEGVIERRIRTYKKTFQVHTSKLLCGCILREQYVTEEEAITTSIDQEDVSHLLTTNNSRLV